MSEAKVTSKGQVTIPIDIRTGLALSAGEKVVFTMLDNGTVVMRSKNRSVQELSGSLSEFAPSTPIDVSEMKRV